MQTLLSLLFWSSSTMTSSSTFFILASRVTFSNCSLCLAASSSSSCCSRSWRGRDRRLTPFYKYTHTHTHTHTHTRTPLVCISFLGYFSNCCILFSMLHQCQCHGSMPIKPLDFNVLIYLTRKSLEIKISFEGDLAKIAHQYNYKITKL